MKLLRFALWAAVAFAAGSSVGVVAKIRGGPAAEAARLEGLLTSYDHDELLGAYSELRGAQRAAAAEGDDGTVKRLEGMAKRFLHRAKSLHYIDAGMPKDEFEHLNARLQDLDALLLRIDTGLRAVDDDEDTAAFRVKSKEINKEIKDIRKKCVLACRTVRARPTRTRHCGPPAHFFPACSLVRLSKPS